MQVMDNIQPSHSANEASSRAISGPAIAGNSESLPTRSDLRSFSDAGRSSPEDSDRKHLPENSRNRLTVPTTDTHEIRTADRREIRIADLCDIRIADRCEICAADRREIRIADRRGIRIADLREIRIADRCEIRAAVLSAGGEGGGSAALPAEPSVPADRPRCSALLDAKARFVTSYAGSWLTNMARQATDVPQLCAGQPSVTGRRQRPGSDRNTDNMAASPRFGGPPTEGSPVGDMDDDSAIGRGSTSPEPQLKVNDSSPCISISDQEESYECYGEAKVNDLSRSSHHSRSQSQPEVPIGRRTWLRTSLRRSSRDSASELPSQFRRYGSMRQSSKRPGAPNGLNSPVYRTPSFNSSGRSSNCDGEDMYSDISLEDDVNDLNHKVQVLERQVTVLAENQNNTDDRYTRSKQENATLQARLIMMEEQLREVEMRAEEQLDSEKRRHRELMQRLEREKALEVENHQIRALSLEKELRFAEEEAARCRQQAQAAAAERAALDARLAELQTSLEEAREETRRAVDLERRARMELERERSAQTQMVAELSRELEDTQRAASLRLKTESDESGLIRLQHSQLEEELRRLRQQNKDLEESNEELQAQLLTTGLQEGRNLLDSGAKSLAAELEDMSGDQLKKSLLEQQEVNKQLRAYIDGILLNIVENYPQLLEVKRKH